MGAPISTPGPGPDTSRWAQWWWTTDRCCSGRTTGALILLGVLLHVRHQPGGGGAARHRLAPSTSRLRQCVFAAIGVVICAGDVPPAPKGVRRVAFVVYLGALLAMFALPFLGHNAKGATRWVEFLPASPCSRPSS